MPNILLPIPHYTQHSDGDCLAACAKMVLDYGQPCIALVRTDQLPYWAYATDHAVLVAGFDEHAVYINDPAFEQSPQCISHADFELAWMIFDFRYAVIWR